MICKRESCTACLACYTACPKNAIFIEKDEYGNVYPKIDEAKCINCGLCEKVCKSNADISKRKDLECYAAQSKNEELLMASASGGIFSSIAESFIKAGGVVCGCSLENENGKLHPKHILVDREENLEKILGSKYVQSDTIEALPLIKQQLKLGKKVLFSGTPCQVAGLKGYLNKDYSSLYTIDLICHGTPNRKIFNDYKEQLEKKYKKDISNIIFRDKKNGWGLKGKIIFKDGKEKLFYANESSYYYLFQKGYFYRKNCYSCPYAGENRTADLTIGDYWGIEKEHPELLDKLNFKKGISCIIVNNENGNTILKDYGNQINKYPTTFKKIQRNNSQLMHPTYEPKQAELLKQYTEKGYTSIEEYFKEIMGAKLLKIKIKNRSKNYLKKMLKYHMKNS